METEVEQKTSGLSSPRPCPECGKIVHGGGGLYGHLLMAHGIKRPNKATQWRMESERLQAEVVWKDTELENLKGQVATLGQEVTRLKRFTWDERCLACGLSLEMFHETMKVDELKIGGKKRRGTLLLCRD
jgi:hypothetical protein